MKWRGTSVVVRQSTPWRQRWVCWYHTALRSQAACLLYRWRAGHACSPPASPHLPAAVSVASSAGATPPHALTCAVQVSEQTDSLRVLGSDPVDYLITPRVMACMIALPILNLLCFCMGACAAAAGCCWVYCRACLWGGWAQQLPERAMPLHDHCCV